MYETRFCIDLGQTHYNCYKFEEQFNMSFMTHYSPTPRRDQFTGPGSARVQNGRPESAKPKVDRNPITV